MLFFMFLWECFRMRFTFKSMDFKESRLLAKMWVDLIQSVEGLNITKGWPSLARGNSASDYHQTSSATWALPGSMTLGFICNIGPFLGLQPDSFLTWIITSAHLWVSSLLVNPADFGFAKFYNCISHFLKINLFINISYWFCFSGDPSLI